MAEDKNKNEDPEEERDDQFDDDEDFGLPDLEYDELDDDDELMDEEPFDDEPEVEAEVPVTGDTEPVGEEVLDEEISDEDLGDFDDSETEDWEKELEKELEDELKSEAESPGFYEEESFDEFDSDVAGTTEESDTTASVFDSDDTDGFDDGIEYSDEPETVKPAPVAAGAAASGRGNSFGPPPVKPNYGYDDTGSSKGKFVRTVVIGTLLFATIALVFYLVYDGGSEEPTEKVAKTEKKAPATPVEAKPEETKPEVKKEEPKPVAKKPEPKKPVANTKPAGEITKLSERTGKTYIVIGSFFDDDIASDFAGELAVDGKSPMVIPPFGESRFYRVAIAEFETFKDAKASLEGFKTEYGQDIWPLRY